MNYIKWIENTLKVTMITNSSKEVLNVISKMNVVMMLHF
jgi:hypothetical protein